MLGSLELARGAALIIRRLIVPLAVALVAGQALAQGAFPAPLPNAAAGTVNDPAFPPLRGSAPVVRGNAPIANDPAFPPVNGSAPVASITPPSNASFPANGAAPLAGGAFERPPAPPTQGGGGGGEACMKEFIPLREDAEKRGKAIKAASDRHATPEEACTLFKAYGQSEIKMIKYVETHSTKCGIPPQVLEQLKGGHKNSESMQQKICNAAQQAQTRGPAGPSLSEVLGSATALPEATKTKKGGSTFDTLNGNVLTR
jgi:hypothetical protein